MEKKCCICEKYFIGYGNNADPIRAGVCCDYCNKEFVLPGRIISRSNDAGVTFEIIKTKTQLTSIEQKLLNKNFWLMQYTPQFTHHLITYRNPESEEKVVLCLV